MNDINLITDKKWIENRKNDLGNMVLSPVDMKIDDFSLAIDNAIRTSKCDYILLMNPMCVSSFSDIKQYVENKENNVVIIYSADMELIDFSQLSNDSFVFFPKKIYKPINKKFFNMLQLQKYILSYFIENVNYDIVGLNRKNNKTLFVDQNRRRFRRKPSKQIPRKKERTKREKIKERKELEIITDIVIPEGRKPKILLVSDVKGWAWWNKSIYLQEYLSDDFDIDIVYIHGDGSVSSIDRSKYDLYLTYGYSYIYLFNRVPKRKRITGVTAHRQLNVIKGPMNKAYAVHANSMLLLNELKKVHSNTFYVPNGVDEKLFDIKIPIPKERENNRLIAGHIGKLTPLKCQKEIIEPAVKKADCDYISHYNTYMDQIPHKDMVDIYQKMDVFIVASIEDGTPNPALEAMACGRPVISNRIGNMPEVIIDGYNGFLIDKDIDEYVKKLEYLKNNRELLIEMGNNARKTIEEGWTIKHMTENYRKMFWEILKN